MQDIANVEERDGTVMEDLQMQDIDKERERERERRRMTYAAERHVSIASAIFFLLPSAGNSEDILLERTKKTQTDRQTDRHSQSQVILRGKKPMAKTNKQTKQQALSQWHLLNLRGTYPLALPGQNFASTWQTPIGSARTKVPLHVANTHWLCLDKSSPTWHNCPGHNTSMFFLPVEYV